MLTLCPEEYRETSAATHYPSRPGESAARALQLQRLTADGPFPQRPLTRAASVTSPPARRRKSVKSDSDSI